MDSYIGDGTTLVSLHRKYYTSTQEHLRKGVRPICTEAQISQCMSRLQQAVFGNKGTPSIICTVDRKTGGKLIVRSQVDKTLKTKYNTETKLFRDNDTTNDKIEIL